MLRVTLSIRLLRLMVPIPSEEEIPKSIHHREPLGWDERGRGRFLDHGGPGDAIAGCQANPIVEAAWHQLPVHRDRSIRGRPRSKAGEYRVNGVQFRWPHGG